MKTKFKKLVEALPKLDGFVSNAGIIKPLLLKFAETDDVNEVLKINTYTPIHLTRKTITK